MGTGGLDESGSAVRAAQDVRAVFSRLRRRLREVASDSDLTATQTAVLARLGKEGPSSASALASVEGVRPQSMATTLAALDRHGLIHRAPDPSDGRRQLITLTPAGRRRADGDLQARREWLARAMQERYTEAERQAIIDGVALLERLIGP